MGELHLEESNTYSSQEEDQGNDDKAFPGQAEDLWSPGLLTLQGPGVLCSTGPRSGVL